MRQAESPEEAIANTVLRKENDAIREAQKESVCAVVTTLTLMRSSLLRKPDFSDLTVVCGNRSWKCQRAILSQRCSFFHAVCTGQYEVCLEPLLSVCRIQYT